MGHAIGTVFVGALLSACVDYGDHDAHVPGEALGTYEIHAVLAASDCGPDALGTPADWTFEVRLSSDGYDLFWLTGGDVHAAALAADGRSFAFQVPMELEIEAPAPGRPGCTIWRTDRAEGELDKSGDDVTAIEGTLSYSFEPAEGADCTPLVGVSGGFAALPCSIEFAMEGRRIQGPGD